MAEVLLIKTEKKLSKAQEAFNKLVKRIERRKAELHALEEMIKKYFVKRNEVIGSLSAERMEWQVKYVRLLDEAYSNKIFSAKDKEKIAQMILNISKPYDEKEQQHPDLLDIPQKYNQRQFDNLSEEEKEIGKEMMQNFMRSMFDVEIDMDEDFSFDNLREKFEAKFNQKLGEENAKAENEESSRRKNKHVGGVTAKSKALAEELNKSWKKIYLKLVKMLHPDAEPDETLKHKKDAALKEVTTAYESSNFYKLLQLHIEYGDAGALPEYFENAALLKQYTSILKKQDEELKDELDMLNEELYEHNLLLLKKHASENDINLHVLREKQLVMQQLAQLKKEVAIFSDLKKLKSEVRNTRLEELLPRNNLFDFDF